MATLSFMRRLADSDRVASVLASGLASNVCVMVLLVVVLVSCSSDDEPPALSTSAQRGQTLAAEYGCSGCHAGLDSDAEVGPSWIGAWGSSVGLADGSFAVVNREYVVTAVRDPGSQLREGDWVRMPVYTEHHLPDEDLELIIDYLRALSPRSDHLDD